MEEITINFGDLIHNLENNNLKLCFLKGRGIFLENIKKELYQMEIYYIGSYLDKLIKNKTVINFKKVNTDFIEEWEKEIWELKKLKEFMKNKIYCNI